MMTVDEMIDIFKNKYDYDSVDEKTFEESNFISELEEMIDDWDGEYPNESEIAECVEEILFKAQYGDTSDVDDLDKIHQDYHERFPKGR